MSATRPPLLLSLPVELRLAIYDILFNAISTNLISTNLDIKGVAGLLSTLQICRCIRSEALPVMLHFIKLRVAELKETVFSLEMVKTTSPLGSGGWNDMEIQAKFFRKQHLQFRLLEGVLRNTEVVGDGGIQFGDLPRRPEYDVESPVIICEWPAFPPVWDVAV